MSLTYGKFVRGLYLVLFTLSSGICLFKPSTHSGLIAILSLVGFVAFDIICQIKKPKERDWTPELKVLEDKLIQTQLDMKDLKNDASIAKIGSAIRRG